MKTKAVFRALTAVCCAVLAAGSCGNPWMEKVVDPLFDEGTGAEPAPVPVPAFEAFYFDIDGKRYGTGSGALAGTGKINKAALTVMVIVPAAAFTSLPAPVTAAGPAGAVVTTAGGTDFSGPRTYTVTANGLSRPYTVTVKQASLIGDGSNSDGDALRAMIEDAATGSVLILAGSFGMNSYDSVNIENKAITILAPAGGTLTLRATEYGTGRIFEVGPAPATWGKLTLGTPGGVGSGSIVFEGRSNSGEPFVRVNQGGHFTMNEGVTMRNNRSYMWSQSPALEIRGTAVINGGTITNCSANNNDAAPVYIASPGAGVGASLTINGGLITGNSGGNGGSIMLKNDANHFLEWNGGIITNNSPNYYTPPNGYGSIYIEGATSRHDIDLHGNIAD
ncbi:MAG: hypothetical protein LBO80_05010 [Treponema sp.]|jgi:hypothetical protein|nr:hypothetical protein [Treponema sp.]